MKKIDELAEVYKIAPSYVDKTGKVHYTDDRVRRFFLKSILGRELSDELLVHKLSEANLPKILPEVVSFFENEKIVLKPEKVSGSFELSLIDEDGRTVWQKDCRGGSEIEIDGISPGYYELVAKEDGRCHKSLLIYAPVLCYQPPFLKRKEHLSGVSLMLYALHSRNSMGIGDFGDLAEIIKLTAQNGGDVVGVNPLGVMSAANMVDDATADVSPYRTLSRLFVNYGYLDLRCEEDFVKSAAVSAFMRDGKTTALLERLNASDLVLYKEVLTLKLKILELMFEHFLQCADAERKLQFETYKADKGEALANLCLFEVLTEEAGANSFWRHWKQGLNDAASVSVRAFAKRKRRRMEFFAYCHWLAELQVKKLQELAVSLGMKIGLYTDMPIGAASNGCEVWENPDVYVLDCTIGAPADPMRPRGQSWGFNPYHPEELIRQHYAPFIRLVRENMRNSGALRIDHAMGLQRLFWGFFERGNPVVQGAYVYYNLKDLTAILSLESNRSRCLVVGEDLGTVPEGFREYMAEHGLLSYKVFYRQKEKNGAFVRPKDYQYLSLAQTSTHDQATACGFWANEDIEVFNGRGLYVNETQYLENLSGRRKDRENMLKALVRDNIIPDCEADRLKTDVEKGEVIPDDIGLYVNQFGASTNSALFLVRLCDIYKQRELDNAPGTVFEYPNWRRKLSVSIEDIATGKEFAESMRIVNDNRPKTV